MLRLLVGLLSLHLAYPILGYFRSQHLNQNWLAALTTIVDASAYALAYASDSHTEAAELTFRIGRHALGDLAHTFSSRRLERDPEPRSRERLSREDLRELRRRLEGSGLHSDADEEASADRLERYSTRTRTERNSGSDAPCKRALSVVSSRR